MKTIQLKRGKYVADFPVSKIKSAKVNRDFNTKHSKSFAPKLTNYHFMCPFIVDTKGQLFDGHHKFEEALRLNQKTVPVYIVDWIKTSDERKFLDAIISLNNGNLKWTSLDYLKQQRINNPDYSYIYNQYIRNKESISVGNAIGCYFNMMKTGEDFRAGKRKIIDKKFGDFLFENICLLRRRYGADIQAYCVREFINIAHNKANRDISVVRELLNRYEAMVVGGDKCVTSLVDFKPAFERELGTIMRLNESN